MRRVHTWIAGLTALALAGCGGMEIQKAQRLTPRGSEFERQLYAGYIELAKLEYDEGDYADADVFALRAAGAASAKASAPENIADRDLPHSKKSGLSVARGRGRRPRRGRPPPRSCSIAGCRSRKRTSSRRISIGAARCSSAP